MYQLGLQQSKVLKFTAVKGKSERDSNQTTIRNDVHAVQSNHGHPFHEATLAIENFFPRSPMWVYLALLRP
jgi:hypothetical protein